MDANSICDKIIKSKLTDILGRTMAQALYSKAQFAAVRAINESERLALFVDFICADPHFIGMWGTAQAARQKQEWLGLYETVPGSRIR